MCPRLGALGSQTDRPRRALETHFAGVAFFPSDRGWVGGFTFNCLWPGRIDHALLRGAAKRSVEQDK